MAFYGERTCYKYYVKNDEYDLQLKFSMYSGLISYNLNPDKQPIDYEDAVYKFIGAASSSMIVTARERKANATTSGLYYICIFPVITSTFSFKVNEIPPNQLYYSLDDGFDEVSEIGGKDI